VNKNISRLRIFLLLLILFTLSCCAQARNYVPTKDSGKNSEVKTVILLIGDGMGLQQRRIAGIIDGGGNPDHRLFLENMDTSGIAYNHSLDAIVTDSAASGTALATGHKTNNDMVSVTPDGKKLPTILEICRDHGKSTGLITTVTIAHATPAVFGAHVENRDWYDLIAAQYLDNKIDVLMGGGWKDFLPENAEEKNNLPIPASFKGTRKDGRNLLNDFIRSGYEFVYNREGLLKIDPQKTKKLLGLFSYGALNFEIDRDKKIEPSIEEMTDLAIKILDKDPDGFFLMVEGGQIDWANHSHDVAGSVYDTIAFDKAVKVALDYASTHPETLIVVVNDHETGGMTIASSKKKIASIKKLKASAGKMASLIKKDGSNINEVFSKYAGINDLKDEEKKMVLDEANGQLKVEDEWGYGGTIIAHIISVRTGILFSTGGHSGCPVVVAAQGPGCEIFNGFYDQSEIPVKMAKLLGVEMK